MNEKTGFLCQPVPEGNENECMCKNKKEAQRVCELKGKKTMHPVTQSGNGDNYP